MLSICLCRYAPKVDYLSRSLTSSLRSFVGGDFHPDVDHMAIIPYLTVANPFPAGAWLVSPLLIYSFAEAPCSTSGQDLAEASMPDHSECFINYTSLESVENILFAIDSHGGQNGYKFPSAVICEIPKTIIVCGPVVFAFGVFGLRETAKARNLIVSGYFCVIIVLGFTAYVSALAALFGRDACVQTDAEYGYNDGDSYRQIPHPWMQIAWIGKAQGSQDHDPGTDGPQWKIHLAAPDRRPKDSIIYRDRLPGRLSQWRLPPSPPTRVSSTSTMPPS